MTTISAVSLDKVKEYVNIKLNNGKTYSYPWIWLRDNCRCEKCLFAVTEARKVLLKDFDVEMKLDKVQVGNEGQTLVLDWPDQHRTELGLNWLMLNRFTDDGVAARKSAHILPIKTWGPEFTPKMVTVDYKEFMADDRVLHKWLVAVEESGLALIENVPLKSRTVKTMAERVNGYLRVQHHGENFDTREIFNIRTDMKQTSDVYTTGRLNYHTDLTYCDTPPGLQMLHCIAQTTCKGGDSIFSDGLRCAEIIKQESPELYKSLTTIPVYYNDFGGYYYDFYYTGYGTTIRLDVDGDPYAIRFANHARYAPMNCPPDQVKTFYKAYKRFDELLEENHVEFKLKPGDLVSFDNQRVLHGRLGYEMEKGGNRHLEGSYIEWDELRSARRVLDHKLNDTGKLLMF